MRTWPAVALVAGCCLIGVAVGGAAASSMTIADSPVETGSVAVTPACANPPLVISSVRSLFTAPGSYAVRRVPVTTINASCQSAAYQLTLAGNTSPFPSLTNWSGTLPAAASGNLDDATGLDVNAVPNANTVRMYMLVRKP